jgi:hypothetical protein
VQRDPSKLTIGSRDVVPKGDATSASRDLYQRHQGGLLAGRPLIPGAVIGGFDAARTT